MDLGNVQLQDRNKTNPPILYEAIKGWIWEQSDESPFGCNFSSTDALYLSPCLPSTQGKQLSAHSVSHCFTL